MVEPLATTFFGNDGYLATAQSNHAAHNLGPRGRTIHAANGLLALDSLQTAKLRLNSASQKKMNRLVGSLGVDVIDELGVHEVCFDADGRAEITDEEEKRSSCRSGSIITAVTKI